jgi:hypothetical protein
MLLLTEDGLALLTEDDEPLIMTPLFDVVLSAVADALAAMLPTAQVARARRAPVEIEERPCLVIIPGSAVPDLTQSPGETFWTFGFTVAGYAAGDDDAAAEAAMMDMHAAVIMALNDADLGGATVQATPGPAEFQLYSAQESAPAAGDFAVGFTALVVAPHGAPFAA